ncbi:MAG: hypothetical protein ABMA13_22315, partial [Chthoniobacteraceae bacterium]
DAYGRCFHPNAQVWLGADPPLALAPFLDSQRRSRPPGEEPACAQPEQHAEHGREHPTAPALRLVGWESGRALTHAKRQRTVKAWPR